MTRAGQKVLLAPFADPGEARTAMTMPEGLTVGEIVAAALPGATAGDLGELRVVLVSAEASRPVPQHLWSHVRPKTGIQVVLRMVPRKDGLRSILLAVVSIAAIALAPTVAGALFGTGYTAAQLSLTGLGLQLAGRLLVNSLVPPTPPPDNRTDRPASTYALTGWSNQVRRNEAIPYLLGQHRMAPPFAATSYTEIVGDDQYVRALFTFGYGPVQIEDLRLGDTSIDNFDDIEVEIREGRADDDPVTLYPQQVLEEPLGVELVRPFPRDDAGEIATGDPIETPVVRTTADDTDIVSLIFGFPSGLFYVKDNGDLRSRPVDIRIRQRLPGGEWSEVETLSIVAQKREGFFRQYTWQLPSRGRWEIEVTRMTQERPDTQTSDRSILSAMQSVRPEYPIAFDKPLALVAMRIRATFQLSGQLDDVNAVVRRYAPDWTGSTWAEGLPRNPAAAFRAALTGPANPYPADISELDLDALADWHDFCTARGFKYDRVHEADETLGMMLRMIARAGRATPRHDGQKWTVVIDRPDQPVIDHVSDRNARAFAWERSYQEPPDAIRVQFADETNGYQPAERIVPWPGHTGPIDLTEDLPLPGKTDPVEIWREARRAQYEVIHRPDVFTCMQDGAARVATRGDLVMGSFQTLDRTLVAARVVRVEGSVIELDERIEMDPAEVYGIRFRVYADEDDSIGTSLVREIANTGTGTALLRLIVSDAMPASGDVVHVGPLATESLPMKILEIEPAEDFSARLSLIAAAPIIDALADAEVPPAWSPRVGAPIPLPASALPAPRITRIASEPVYAFPLPGAGDPEAQEAPITVLLAPGVSGAVLLSSYRIEHRLQGAPAFDSVTLPTTNGGAQIDGYMSGQVVELRAISIAANGAESPASPAILHTVGSGAAPLPAPLDPGTVTAQGGPGFAAITVLLPIGSATTSVSVFRTAPGVAPDLDTDRIGSPAAITPGTALTLYDGDATRTNAVSGGDFATGDDWTAAGGWTIAGGKATHTPGSLGTLDQPLSLTAGTTYRWSITVSDRTASSVYLRIEGDTDVETASVADNGFASGTFVAPANVTGVTVVGRNSFDGSVDDIAIYAPTPTSAAQGAVDYYVSPQNVDDVLGALAGPFSTVIS